MASPTKFYHVTQIILWIWSCDQSLTTPHFYERSYHNLNFKKILTTKNTFFEECSWFRFNNLGLALAMALIIYTSVAKGLKLKVKRFWGLIPKFVKFAREKLVGGPFCPSILNRVNTRNYGIVRK